MFSRVQILVFVFNLIALFHSHAQACNKPDCPHKPTHVEEAPTPAARPDSSRKRPFSNTGLSVNTSICNTSRNLANINKDLWAAIEPLSKKPDLNPSSSVQNAAESLDNLRYVAAALFTTTEDPTRALPYYSGAIIHPDAEKDGPANLKDLQDASHLVFQNGEFEAAALLCERAILHPAADKASFQHYENLRGAAICRTSQGKIKLASQHLAQALAHPAASFNSIQYLFDLQDLSKAQLQTGDYADSAVYSELCLIHPLANPKSIEHLRDLRNAGKARFQTGDFENASLHFEEALIHPAANPKSINYFSDLQHFANSLYRTEQFDLSARQWERALTHPASRPGTRDNLLIYLNAAKARLKHGDLVPTLEHITKLFEQAGPTFAGDPKVVDIWKPFAENFNAGKK